jgi:hypothetical protein
MCFKQKLQVHISKKLNRHSRRPIWKICHLPDPPLFSLFSTFKDKGGCNDLGQRQKMRVAAAHDKKALRVPKCENFNRTDFFIFTP